jgi:CRP-like cAMP-binding protein
MKVNDLLSGKLSVGLGNTEPKQELPGASRVIYPEGATIFEPGGNTSRILLVTSGWAVSSKFLPSGTRIVTDFALRGDMISTTAAELAHETVQALTPVECYGFSDGFSDHGPEMSPRLSRIVILEMMKRQARMAERLTNIGRRDALERTGHLLLELGFRAEQSTKTNFDGFVCPLRQSDIGDAVGLSTVHINRVLKDMRLKGLLGFRNGIVEFLDRPRLVELVDFDAAYL